MIKKILACLVIIFSLHITSFASSIASDLAISKVYHDLAVYQLYALNLSSEMTITSTFLDAYGIDNGFAQLVNKIKTIKDAFDNRSIEIIDIAKTTGVDTQKIIDLVADISNRYKILNDAAPLLVNDSDNYFGIMSGFSVYDPKGNDPLNICTSEFEEHITKSMD